MTQSYNVLHKGAIPKLDHNRNDPLSARKAPNQIWQNTGDDTTNSAAEAYKSDNIPHKGATLAVRRNGMLPGPWAL